MMVDVDGNHGETGSLDDERTTALVDPEEEAAGIPGGTSDSTAWKLGSTTLGSFESPTLISFEEGCPSSILDSDEQLVSE